MKYRYEVQKYEKVYEIHLEQIINSAVRNGGRLVNVDYGPGVLRVIVEHEIKE